MRKQATSPESLRDSKPVQPMQIQQSPAHRLMRENRGKTVLLATLFAGLHAPLTAHAAMWAGSADTSMSTSAFASYDHDGNPQTSEIQSYKSDNPGYVEDTAAAGISITSSSSTALSGSPLTNTTSDSVGSAMAGRVGAQASVAVNTTTGYGNSGFGTANAVASWGDSVLIDKAGLTNSTGYLSATLVLGGNLSAQVSDQTSGNLQRAFATVSVTGLGLTPVYGQVSAGGCLSDSAYCAYAFAGASDFYGAPGNGTFEFGSRTLSVYIPFTFGQVFYLGYTMKTEAKAQAIVWDGNADAGSATGTASFAHTLAWGGIDSIVQGGAPVEGFSLTSGSGLDYRPSAVAVPEPETYAMLLVGLGMMASIVRRRKRSDASR